MTICSHGRVTESNTKLALAQMDHCQSSNENYPIKSHHPPQTEDRRLTDLIHLQGFSVEYYNSVHILQVQITDLQQFTSSSWFALGVYLLQRNSYLQLMLRKAAAKDANWAREEE